MRSCYLEQLKDGGVVVGVLHLQLGPGPVEHGEEGEVAGVRPVAADDEEGAEDGEDDDEDDVEEVEPHVDGEEGAASPQRVPPLLRKITLVPGGARRSRHLAFLFGLLVSHPEVGASIWESPVGRLVSTARFVRLKIQICNVYRMIFVNKEI